MQENENTSAWICPTDRHLALRAKLKSGWSVRSNQSTRKDVPEYTPEELNKIQDVISKAAILEDLEQQRIGSLVQKLGLMKDNSAGDGVLTCVLCAEPFGKFMGSTPVICTDCKKKVCNKCCVDYYTGVRPSARKQSAQNSSFHWLCKICSEDRELWKRSGAWFFQALPRYKLPTPQLPLQHKRYAHSVNPASSPITPRRGRALDSTDGKKGHARVMSGGSVQSFQWGKPARPDITSSSEESDSSDDDGITLGKPKKTDSQASDSVSYTSSTSAASFDKPTLSASSSPAVHRRLSQRRTRLQKNTPETNPTEAQDRTSVDSHVTDSSAEHAAGSVDMSNLHSGSDRTPVAKQTSTEHMNYKGDRGSIEFSVTYDPSRCALHVRINRAQDLIGMDSNGLSDPYVKLHLLPGMSRSTKLRTKTRSKTLNPVFNELLTYWGVKEEELPKRKLLVTVLDEDKFGHDFIGEVAVPLMGITPNNTKKSFELPLKAPYALSEAEKQATDPGRIHVGLHYNLDSHSLSVKIHRCANLVPRKKDQENVNAFVKVTLSLDDRRTIVHKTEVKKKTFNPVFDRELKFQVSADNGQAELARGSLTVAVVHGHNTIGHVMFGISSSGEQLKQWFNCLKHADQQFDGWHILSSESLKKHKGKS